MGVMTFNRRICACVVTVPCRSERARLTAGIAMSYRHGLLPRRLKSFHRRAHVQARAYRALPLPMQDSETLPQLV
jgi:hypothetical protein